MNTEYFMLKVEGGSPPRKIHETLEEAMAEAERLVQKENAAVDVLVATYRCVPKVRRTKDIVEDLTSDSSFPYALAKEVIDRLLNLQTLVDGAYTAVEERGGPHAPPAVQTWRECWLALAKSLI